MKAIATFRHFSTALCLMFGAAGAQGAAAPDVDPTANPPTPAFDGQTGAPRPGHEYEVEVVATGLQLPRSLVALPDGNLLVTEGSGTVRLLRPGGSLSLPLAGMPPIRSVNGRSMNDFILGHDFEQNRTVYFAYAAPPEGQPGGPVTPQARALALQNGEVFQVDRIARARLAADYSAIENVEVIAEVPARRLFSAPDGSLYVSTTGFGDNLRDVQKLNSLAGKFLRLNADGSVPKDNPFSGRTMVKQEILSIGHRDPDGMAIHPATGELWAVEHGPMGGDELNIIRPGRNYGWPLVTYGKNYDGTEIGPSARTGTEQPIYYWFPSIAPSGLMFYDGDLFPQWRGDVFLGAMSPTQGKFLVRLEMDGERVIAEDRLLVDRDRRIRAVTQGADGAVYVLTDSEDNTALGRHFPGEVLKLAPPAAQ